MVLTFRQGVKFTPVRQGNTAYLPSGIFIYALFLIE